MSPDDGAAEEALGDEVPDDGKGGAPRIPVIGESSWLQECRKAKDSSSLSSDIDRKIMARSETES